MGTTAGVSCAKLSVVVSIAARAARYKREAYHRRYLCYFHREMETNIGDKKEGEMETSSLGLFVGIPFSGRAIKRG